MQNTSKIRKDSGPKEPVELVKDRAEGINYGLQDKILPERNLWGSFRLNLTQRRLFLSCMSEAILLFSSNCLLV